MDNITLTIKDADFISNFIRSQMESLNKAYTNAINDINSSSDCILSLAKIINDDEINNKIADYETQKKASLEEIEKDYQNKINIFEKILLLMACGSTD